MELTAKKIKEGLVNFSTNTKVKIYYPGGDDLIGDALFLINELTEDIEWSAKRILEADKKVAELTEENERLKHTISQMGKNNDELARVLPLAKKEVEGETAREIFKEIDRLIVRRMIADIPFIDERLITDITELKKKYTEGDR